MDEQQKIIDSFVRKTIKSTETEKPSIDFTANIMSKIIIEKQSEATKYKSLISKLGWAAIFIVVTSLFAFFYLNDTTEELGWLSTIDYSVFKENQLMQFLSTISMTNSAVYGIIALAVMTIIQVPIYRNYYNKRLRM